MPASIVRILPLVAALALAVVGGGCGNASSGGAAGAHNATRPGAGRPPVTVGTKTSPVSVLLGQLYAQALHAQGYTVELREDVRSTRDAVAELRRGRIDVYPASVDAFDDAAGLAASRMPSADAAWAAGRAAAAGLRLTLLAPTPFTTASALAVLPAAAQRHRLASIADLARLRSLRLGASPGFRTRAGGLRALRSRYGIRGMTYFPLTTGVQYQVLDAGKIDVAEVATTDGQLAQGAYTLLRDPLHLFGFQHVAPVVPTRVLVAEGAPFTRTLDRVSARLTPAAMQEMNAAVAIANQSPEQVARRFLAQQGLG